MNRFDAKTIAIAVLVAIVIGAGMYFVGRATASSAAAAERAELQAQIQSTQVEMQQLEQRLVAAENMTQLLRARGQLYEAVIELDRRNFGLANTRLQQAGQGLASLRPAAAGVDAQETAEVRRLIQTTDVNVATNLQAQRARLLEFAERLGALVPQ